MEHIHQDLKRYNYTLIIKKPTQEELAFFSNLTRELEI